SGSLEHDGSGSLVRAQALEYAVPNIAVGRELREVDFGDEVRRDEDRVAARLARQAREGRGLAATAGKFGREFVQRTAFEGADATFVGQLAALHHADQHGSERPPPLVGPGVAADDEFLPAGALQLEPAASAAGPVGM